MVRGHILCCGGTGCTSSGCDAIIKEMEAQLAAHDLEKEFKIIKTGCFGLCALGPIMIVYPEGAFYSRVTPEDVKEIVEEHLVKGRVVKRLLYAETIEEDNIKSLNEVDFYKKQMRVALRNCGVINPEDIEEYIAIDDVKNAVYVFERITPNHCSTYEMQWGHYATADYTKAVTTMLYNALIKQGKYEQAWKYHKLEYEDVDYPGNASCYYSYITDVLETLCQNKQIREAQEFLDDHISWFRRNVDNAKYGESYQEYSYRRMKEKLQLFIDEYTKGGE